MRRSTRWGSWALALVAALVMAVGAASAHPDHTGGSNDDGVIDNAKDTHAHGQHGLDSGHLPASSANVALVGKIKLRQMANGRIADVAAMGNYAYLGAFWEPDCKSGGVYVVDISAPSAPREVAFVRAAPGSYVGEGVQVITMNTPSFKGDLLVHNNEICGTNPGAVGGISLVDVTKPAQPRKLVDGFGDFTNEDGSRAARAHESHSVFMWTTGPKAYAVFVDNEEGADVDIADITDPSNPRLISETNLNDLDVAQPELGLTDSWHHDVVVKKIGKDYVMLVSYWDGGYVQLNVNDPANPVYLSDTDYAATDPERAARGHTIEPEGNGHQAEFTRDNSMFLATDEDFSPFRMKASITGGPNAGHAFRAIQGDSVPQIDDTTTLVGATAYVGQACTTTSVPSAASTGATIAVVERGGCTFTTKAGAVSAAGYQGGIVFNSQAGDPPCDQLVSMLVSGNIPFLFVARSDGLRILGVSDPAAADCATAAPAVGSAGSPVDIHGVFDGWGYVHLYDRRSLRDLDTYAVPESQDRAYATGFGDLSIHEVATDPDRDLAYFSYYGAGFRVVEYSRSKGITEVGHYIAEGGNNFWGVEVLKHPNGQKYVLASDRDSGLWIFQYTGK
jgi:hypothetical protein